MKAKPDALSEWVASNARRGRCGVCDEPKAKAWAVRVCEAMLAARVRVSWQRLAARLAQDTGAQIARSTIQRHMESHEPRWAALMGALNGKA